MAYLGASPLASFASPSKDTFSGDNSTTSFTMGQSAPDANSIEVFVDNVRQEPTSAYTVNGTTLTFTGTPATGSNRYLHCLLYPIVFLYYVLLVG